MLFLASCQVDQPANLLLITVDTLRPDRLSCYGYEASRTPNIDALAARGVVFDRAFCDVTWTTPSMASTFTGRFAVNHGLQSSHQRLPETTTIAGILRARGYATAAVVGSFPVDSTFGFSQGFEVYDEEFDTSIVADRPPGSLGAELPADAPEAARKHWMLLERMERAYRPDDEVADRAIAWLQGEKRRPFFLWIHFFGPHERMYLDLPLDKLIQRNLADYDPDLRFTDAQVGRVLDALRAQGLEGNTVVALHADHGQNLFESHYLGQHYVGHGRDLHEPSLRIPLIVAGPGVTPGLRSNAFARNVDILPTTLDLLGVAAPDDIDGQSLARALRYPWLAKFWRMSEGETYAETYLSATSIFAFDDRIDGRRHRFGFVHRGVRTSRWKYVESEPVPLLDDLHARELPPALVARHRRSALYDLHNDAFEGANVAAAHPEQAEALRTRLRDYLAGARRAPTAVLDPAARDRLRALGYVE